MLILMTLHDSQSSLFLAATFTKLLAANLQYNCTRLIEGEVTQYLHRGIRYTAPNCQSEHTVLGDNIRNPYKTQPAIPCLTIPSSPKKNCANWSTLSAMVFLLR
uniref:Uncharacterized protein n=1 Tax=Rhipicephalus zambeziensis TaxID=60191 RepID=A0A224Y7Q6_9ACAR